MKTQRIIKKWVTMAVVGLLAGLSVRAQSRPTILEHPQSMIVAPGSTIELHVKATGQGTLHYRWRINGRTVRHHDVPSLVVSNVTQAIRCDVVVSDEQGLALSRAGLITLFSISRGEDGVGLNLYGHSGPDYEYAIQYVPEAGSTDWITITNLALPSRHYRWVDLAVTNTTQRFYRAVLVSTPFGPAK